jgi:prephenate dehydrogenase
LRIAVVGTGLIGGSVGLAARRRLGATVRGFGPEAQRAVGRGALDVACETIEEAVEDAEIAFVAAPLGVLGEAVDAVLAAAPATCVVTDVGSTKAAIVSRSDDERFVGGHPLAGGEAAGVDHAREDLFEGAVWYLTPGPTTSGVLFERLHRALSGLGARPSAIDADVHDRLMAAVSHLPHVLANVLVAQAIRAVDDGETIPATGPSFRDATRVAGANPALWPDILLGNRDALVSQIDDAVRRLGDVRAALLAGDRGAVAGLQEVAAAERRALLETHLGEGPTRELRVAVPNRPGVIADLALGLGRAGINIADMALAPSPDQTQGEVTLWVAEPDAPRACDIIGAMGFPVT